MLENHLKKRLIVRAQNRGIKEMDIILGNFVRARIDIFTASDCEELEAMMMVDDQALYAMLTGHQEINQDHQKWLSRIKLSLNIEPNLI